MQKTDFRMFGDRETFTLNEERIPQRTLKSLRDELRWLYNRMMEQKEPGFHWDYALTSENDRVFPSENVNSYWEKQKDTRHIIVPFPHYLFHLWRSFDEFVDFVESRGAR